MTRLPSADITWRADGSPQSSRFDDIYFSSDDGLAETNHVFLQNNGLPAAWKDRAHFTIAETGFGTGLNFLATWALWRETRAPGQQLHFISVEGFPLARDELAQALEKWPDLAPLANTLIARYPTPHRGTHLIHLSDGVTLTLCADEIAAALRGLEANVDAWFLDGFSPASNPDMWSEEVFAEVARLSKPGTTLATFTAAGAVRRGLQAQGFDVQKVKGFGRKREMLVGEMQEPPERAISKPWYQVPQTSSARSVLVVGAGIAGAATAHALHSQDVDVHLVDRQGLGSGASGNPAALFMPRFSVQPTPEDDFHIAAYLYAERRMQEMQRDLSIPFFQACGVMQFARTDAEATRFEKIAARAPLPPGHLELIPAANVAERVAFDTGYPAFLFPRAGVIDPARLLAQLTRGMSVDQQDISSLADVATDHGVDALVLANGQGLAKYPETDWLPLEPVLGQITDLPTGAVTTHEHALVAGAYLITRPDGSALTGATYELGNVGGDDTPTVAGHQANLDDLAATFPTFSKGLSDLEPTALSGRVSFRAQVPDRVPFAGPAPIERDYLTAYDRLRHGDRFAAYPPSPVHPGLFLMGGLGARGFTTGLLLGEFLAAQITGAPSPLQRELAEAVHPARFIIRALRKNSA
jgi:tRNA 5-methylaminomethyl-2-thiouridine biosynthesis bifunctional protein